MTRNYAELSEQEKIELLHELLNDSKLLLNDSIELSDSSKAMLKRVQHDLQSATGIRRRLHHQLLNQHDSRS